MKTGSRSDDGQLVYLDPFLIDRLRLNSGLSQKKLAGEAGIAFNTLRELYRGGGLQPHTARVIATKLGCEVTDLLAPHDPRYVVAAQPPGPWNGEAEWETDGYLDQSRLAANGLYYIVCRMRHRHTSGRRGRGKFYHLSWLPPAARDGMRDKLTRHADVCARVGQHRRIVCNLSSTPVGSDGWWVIDDWVGEQTLADTLNQQAWSGAELARLLLAVGQGLQALHAAGVVFRELAPARVLLRASDGSAVLSDFELAKLLDGSPSVSSEWPEDPFRAPEVDGGQVTVQADLYSLAKLTVAAAAGPDAVSDDRVPVLFGKAGMPKRLARLMMDCLEPVPARRSPELAPLLRELARWSEK